MKKHSYAKLISMSWDWMVQVLFRPFSLKKWIMLAIIIFLAGQLGANFNINIGGRGNFDRLLDTIRKKVPLATVLPAPPKTPFKTPIAPANRKEINLPQGITPIPDAVSKLSQIFKSPKTAGKITLLISPLVLLIIFIIFLWMWVKANFSFVFLDSVAKNDASLRMPFHRNKPQGNSFFRWSVIYSFTVLLIFGIILSFPLRQLIQAGTFSSNAPINAAQTLSIVLYYVPLLIVTGILFALIQIFLLDFVLPVMYKKKIGILKAWGLFLGLLRRNIGEMLLYLLVKLGLSILALVAAIIVAIIGIIALIVIGALIALLGYLIYTLTPGAAKGIILVVLVLIGIPAYAFLGFLFNLLFIPIPIFFRIFSIHVLGSLDESLDLFAPKTPEEILLEGDEDKYKRSMRLVWFAVLSPFLVAILGIVLAIAIPNFVKIKTGASRAGKRGIEDIISIEKIKSVRELTKKKSVPMGEPVTVYLKNGNTFEAELIAETEDNVAFRIEGGTVVYPRSDILRIEQPQEEK